MTGRWHARAIAYGGGRSDPRVSGAEIAAALANTDRPVRRALEEAIASVRKHHEEQVPESVSHETRPGVRIDRRWTALHRVGAYIPGGKASYPSSLVMTTVPAQVAGVDEIVVASPCDEDGGMDRTLMAACALLGLDEVYAMGGAQAVAALAFGTETIRRGGQDRGSWQRLGDGRQAGGVRDLRHRPSGRT